MGRVELAKMLGLGLDCEEWYPDTVNVHEIKYGIWENGFIRKSFLLGKLKVDIDLEDFAPDKLDIKQEDLVEEGDIKVCIKQVSDLLWERAADEYLMRIKRTALVIGGE